MLSIANTLTYHSGDAGECCAGPRKTRCLPGRVRVSVRVRVRVRVRFRVSVGGGLGLGLALGLGLGLALASEVGLEMGYR
jgi:hypothetical protein